MVSFVFLLLSLLFEVISIRKMHPKWAGEQIRYGKSRIWIVRTRMMAAMLALKMPTGYNIPVI